MAAKTTDTKFLINLLEENGFVFATNKISYKKLKDGILFIEVASSMTIRIYFSETEIGMVQCKVNCANIHPKLSFISRKYNKIGQLLMNSLDVIVERIKKLPKSSINDQDYECYVFLKEQSNAIFSNQSVTSNGKFVNTNYFSTVTGFVE